MTDGYGFEGNPKLEYVAHQVAGHRAGAAGASIPAPRRISIPKGNGPRAVWDTRHRFAKISRGCIRSWLFLASAQKLQPCLRTKNPGGFLEGQICCEHEARYTGSTAAETVWLACNRGVGM